MPYFDKFMRMFARPCGFDHRHALPALEKRQWRSAAAGFALLGGASLFAAGEVLRPGDTVAICGDSITEQRLYTVLIEDYLLMCQPVPIAGVYQAGWSGEPMRGLLNRTGSHILPFRPTVVTALYGMNDGGYKPTDPDTVASFQKDTEAVIQALRAGGVRSILVASPSAVDTEKFKSWPFARNCSPEEYNRTLYDLGQAAKAAAERQGEAWADVHGATLAAMVKAKARYGQGYPLAMDGVHPSINGQLVIAHALLKALGCTGDIGTITLDARTGAATATEGHKIIRASANEMEVESVRYPFCFTDDPKNSDSTAAMLDCVPFNEDLNRFRLVISNAPAKMKVTWEGETRIFTAEQSAQGIDLVGAFSHNPFQEAFARVENAVKLKQAFETSAIKDMLNSLLAWRKYLPEKQAFYDEMQAAILAKERQLNDSTRGLVRPVRHKFKIEALPADLGR